MIKKNQKYKHFQTGDVVEIIGVEILAGIRFIVYKKNKTTIIDHTNFKDYIEEFSKPEYVFTQTYIKI